MQRPFFCDKQNGKARWPLFGDEMEYMRKRLPDNIKELVIQRSEHTCSYCGVSDQETELQIDHIIPVAKGGSNSIENLTAACWKCNAQKTDRTIDEWDLHCQETFGLTLPQYLVNKYLSREKKNGRNKQSRT